MGNVGLCVALLCAPVDRVAVEIQLFLVVVFVTAHVNLRRETKRVSLTMRRDREGETKEDVVKKGFQLTISLFIRYNVRYKNPTNCTVYFYKSGPRVRIGVSTCR